LRQSINIIKSKIITLEASLQSDVTESANFIKLALEDYSQVIYTKYIERLEKIFNGFGRSLQITLYTATNG